jgi:hypothetical protein
VLGGVFHSLDESSRSRCRGRATRQAGAALAAVLVFAASSTTAWARIRSADDGTSPLVSLVAEISTTQATATPPVELTLFAPDQGNGASPNAPTAAVFRAGQSSASVNAVGPEQEVRATAQSTGAILSSVYATGENSAAPASMRGQRSYYAAYAKAGTRFSTAGPGGIMVREPNGATRPFVTIPNVVPGPATADGAGDSTTLSFPNGAGYSPTEGGLHLANESILNSAGLVSLGGMALDSGERWLYAVNLNNRTIYGVDTWAPTPIAVPLPALPALTAPATCNGNPGDLRPGGVVVWRGRLLLGTTCTGAASGADADVSADVWIYDLEGRTWMNDAAMHTTFGDNTSARPAHHWSATVLGTAPKPKQLLLLRLDITESGGLLLGFRNRGADTTVVSTADDRGLVAIAPPVSGGWADPFLGRPADQAAIGPGGLLGGATAIPGSPWGLAGEEIAAARSADDGTGSANPGVVWFDRQSTFAVGQESAADATSAALPGSVGAVTLMAGWRSVVTTVFRDTNGDSIQQPTELPLDGIRLNILQAGDDAVRAIATSGELDGRHGQMRMYVPPFNRYRIQVDPTSFAPGGLAAGARRSSPGNELRLGVRNEQATGSPIGITLVPSPEVLSGAVTPTSSEPTAEPMPAAGRRTTLALMAAGTLLMMGAICVRVTRLSVKTRHRLRHAGAHGKH